MDRSRRRAPPGCYYGGHNCSDGMVTTDQGIGKTVPMRRREGERARRSEAGSTPIIAGETKRLLVDRRTVLRGRVGVIIKGRLFASRAREAEARAA